MSQADGHRSQAVHRCAQVCKNMGWVPPTSTCCMQMETGYHMLGLAPCPGLFSAALIKGEFFWRSSQPLQVSWGWGWLSGSLVNGLSLPRSILVNGSWPG